jgi:hypothetical protein
MLLLTHSLPVRAAISLWRVKTMINERGCKHRSFNCEQVDATGSNIKIAIVRCATCGVAIGAFLPQVPNALNVLGEGIEAVREDIKKLPR